MNECNNENWLKNIPRRSKAYENVPAELAIQNAVDEVEKLGANIKLTDAVILLARAKDLVSDFIDGVSVTIIEPTITYVTATAANIPISNYSLDGDMVFDMTLDINKLYTEIISLRGAVSIAFEELNKTDNNKNLCNLLKGFLITTNTETNK